MKHLLLMRHAKSNQAIPGQLDMDRTLHERGEKDAMEMGKRFKQQQFTPQLILSSSATRTRETAIIVAQKLAYDTDMIMHEPLLYMAHTDEVLYLIRNLDSELKHVLLIGHNPSFESLIGILTQNMIEKMPTAGAALVSFDIPNWQQISNHKGKLEWFDFPKNN